MMYVSANKKAVSLNVHRYAAEGLRPGAVFVTVLCPLSSDKFELVEEVELSFSWGTGGVNVDFETRIDVQG